MTKITLSTGDKYTIEAPAAEIMQAMNRDRWISLEDNGRDIRVRSSHIVAIEEDTAAIIKEAEQATAPAITNRIKCCICGAVPSVGRPLIERFGKHYCIHCSITTDNIKYLAGDTHGQN